MAGDPNERIGNAVWLESDKDLKDEQIPIPAGYVVGQQKGQYYAAKITHADGHTTIEWYQRQGQGEGKPDTIAATTAGPVNTKQAGLWKADAGKEKPGNVYVGVNPHTGRPTQVTETPDPTAPGGVRRSYDDTQVPATARTDTEWHTEGTPLPGGGFDNSKPVMVRTVNGVQQTRQPTYAELQDWQKAGQAARNPGGKTDAELRADAGKTARVPETIGGKAYDKVTTETKGPGGETITEAHYEDPANPGVKIPTPMAAPTSLGVALGSVTTSTADGKTKKTTTYLRPDGTQHEVVDTAEVAKNTETERDPSSGRTYEIVRNPDGSVKERREVQTTGPGTQASYTYPELKLAYGNIANEVMAISRDIYSRVGTGPGKITKEEADRLFKPIYDQAQMRVAEINGIVSTQKSVWDQQLATANQRLDASTRMAGQAFGLAKDANLMAPGTGATAGHMVWDMMNAQKDFAGSMGGLTDPKLPGYLQAAMTMSPDAPGGPPPSGFPPSPGGPQGAAPPSGADVAAANAATQAQSGAAFGGLGIPPTPSTVGTSPVGGAPDGISPFQGGNIGSADVTTDAGGVPRAFTPASSTVGSGVPPAAPAPVPGQQPVGPTAGITINIGHPGQAQQADPSQAYLQPAAQPQRPSLADHQKEAAGALLGMGFDTDVIDHLWRQNTGRGLAG